MSNEIDTKIYSNGLHVVHQQSLHDLPICSIFLFCDIGSAFETNELRGIAHFLEHILLQGTKTRDSNQLFQEYDRIGKGFNAVTTKRYTCFHVKCHADHGERVLHLLTDMMQCSKIDKSSVEREKKIINHELYLKKKLSFTAYTFFENAVYKYSSFEYPIDHENYNRTSISQDTLKRWYEWFYQPHNIVLSIVSNRPFSFWKNIISETKLSSNKFREKNISKPREAFAIPMQFPSIETGNETIDVAIELDENAKTTFLVWGFRTVNQYSEKKYAFELIAEILNGMSGRLFHIFRQKHKLVYTIEADSGEEEFNGFFAVSIEFNGKELKTVVELLCEMFTKLVEKGFTNTEFHTGRDRLRGSHHIQYENINTFANHNGLQQLLFIRDRKNVSDTSSKKIIPFQKMWDRVYKKITINQLENLMKEYFVYRNIVVSIVTAYSIHLDEIKEWCKKYKR